MRVILQAATSGERIPLDIPQHASLKDVQALMSRNYGVHPMTYKLIL